MREYYCGIACYVLVIVQPKESANCKRQWMERCKVCGAEVPVSSSRRTLNASTSTVQINALIAISNKIVDTDYVYKKCWLRGIKDSNVN